jgi:hypothetical protein
LKLLFYDSKVRLVHARFIQKCDSAEQCLSRCLASFENGKDAGGADAEEVCERVDGDDLARKPKVSASSARQESNTYVEENISEQQPGIPPMIGVVDVEASSKQLFAQM